MRRPSCARAAHRGAEVWGCMVILTRGDAAILAYDRKGKEDLGVGTVVDIFSKDDALWVKIEWYVLPGRGVQEITTLESCSSSPS